MELLKCPFCGFDRSGWEDHKRLCMILESQWDTYIPKLIQEPLASTWGVTCQNCGASVFFGDRDKESAIKSWNTRATNLQSETP